MHHENDNGGYENEMEIQTPSPSRGIRILIPHHKIANPNTMVLISVSQAH